MELKFKSVSVEKLFKRIAFELEAISLKALESFVRATKILYEERVLSDDDSINEFRVTAKDVRTAYKLARGENN